MSASIEKTRIMLVEDDVFMQTLLNEFLSAKFTVATFLNGMDAIASLQGGSLPDLIISDLNIPELSGTDLIIQVKASNFFKNIPIMILSGDESSEMRIKCLNAGADDFVVKPFNPRELDARINVILRRQGKSLMYQ